MWETEHAARPCIERAGCRYAGAAEGESTDVRRIEPGSIVGRQRTRKATAVLEEPKKRQVALRSHKFVRAQLGKVTRRLVLEANGAAQASIGNPIGAKVANEHIEP